jgi:hypothetical protein
MLGSLRGVKWHPTGVQSIDDVSLYSEGDLLFAAAV